MDKVRLDRGKIGRNRRLVGIFSPVIFLDQISDKPRFITQNLFSPVLNKLPSGKLEGAMKFSRTSNGASLNDVQERPLHIPPSL